ncbi:MAG: penicillin acylase family protein, partial [Bacteroidota bacterium]
MKKWLMIGLAGLIALLGICGGGAWWFLQDAAPDYDADRALPGLAAEVEVLYDAHGIPHIYAENERDAYRALGYIHAEERLFQMELIRRVAAGRLAEILGPDLVETDAFFRTIGLHVQAEKMAEDFRIENDVLYVQAATAYLEGINTFIEKGATPAEFAILGIPKAPFTDVDLFNVAGYMAFGFAAGFKIDPVLERLYQTHGQAYLNDLSIDYRPGTQIIPTHRPDTTQSKPTLSAAVHKALEKLPIPLLVGSNGWVIGGTKTADGQVIFANDPHIGYSQPAVWFEAA